MSEAKREFTHLRRAWYGDACLRGLSDVADEITIGMYYAEGSTDGEFCVRWTVLGHGPAVPVLIAFDDSWKALLAFRDLLEKMAECDDRYITPDDLCKLLVSLGIEDTTHMVSPYEQTPEEKKRSGLTERPHRDLS